MTVSTKTELPQFNAIDITQIEPQLDAILRDNRESLENLLQQPSFTWENLLRPLEDLSDTLDQFWSIIHHLHSVRDFPSLRTAYHACLPKLSQYQTEITQNQRLYEAILSIAEGPEYQQLNPEQKKVIDNDLRDFELAGVHLPPQKKARLAELHASLDQLTTRYEENVLDATQGWRKLITEEKELSGIPAHEIQAAKAAAEKKQLHGWLFTLDTPSYSAIMLYADSASLREEMYYAHVTLASDQGPQAGKWDNTQIIEEIMQKRLETSQLLGFQNFAELSLSTKMAKTPDEVLEFLNQLLAASLPKAQKELKTLAEFAKEKYGVSSLQAWDIGYYKEKLRQHRYAISDEELRPFFPDTKVVTGLFQVVKQLFGVEIIEQPGVETWEPTVRCFALYDREKQLRSYFYLDLYTRDNKRGGAWIAECRMRRRFQDGTQQLPITFITCNFNPPIENQPALLTHDDVITLFHEFGHALQHMLSQIDYPSISGINGIPWDAVEVSSQLLENWVWEKNSLMLFATHYQENIPLPADLLQRMQAARNFHSALHLVRQVEMALFDFKLHISFSPQQKNSVQKLIDEIRTQIALLPVPAYNRFQNGFTHLFSSTYSGYAAGYYSYLWAEVMASDAFSLFKEKDIFDIETSQKFLETFLERGGADDPLDLFIRFRGHAPRIEALLKQLGIN